MRTYPIKNYNPTDIVRMDDACKFANESFFDGYILGRLQDKKKIDAISVEEKILLMVEAIAVLEEGDADEREDKT